MHTVNALAIELVTEFGGWTTNTTYVTKVERFINDAFKDVMREAQWAFSRTSETINTVANIATYELASGAAEVVSARLSGSYDQKLIYTPVEHMQTLDLELVARPMRWWQNGFDQYTGSSTLQIWPVPDAVYPVEIMEIVRPVDLLTGDTIPVPDEILGLMKDRVRHIMCMDDRDFASADRWLSLYMVNLKTAKARYSHDTADERMNPYNDLPQRRPIPLVRLPYEYGGF